MSTIRIDLLQPDLFLDSPGEYLVKKLAEHLKSVPQFAVLFGENIDPYKRMDYGISNLPAIRLYNDNLTKDTESWFVEGNITADIIFPPSIRREMLQQVQDTVTSAVLQQFRRPSLIENIEEGVPGINELGKIISADKSLGFVWGEEAVPLTRLQINFRIDLRMWDEYMTESNRTKEDPFEITLQKLKLIATIIQGLKDETVELEMGANIPNMDKV